MKNRKTALFLVLVMLCSLVNIAPKQVKANEELNITFTATATENKVSVTGSVNQDLAAVMVEVIGTAGSLAMKSFAVSTSNTFSGEITGLSLTKGAEYTVRIADYDGGAWSTVTATVPDDNPGTTTPTDPPVQPPVSDPTANPSSGSETTSEPVTEPVVTPVEEKPEVEVITDDGNAVANFKMGNLEEGKAEVATELNPESEADAELLDSLFTEEEQKSAENGEKVAIIFEAEKKELDKKEEAILEDDIEKLEEITNGISEPDADIPEELKDISGRTPAPSGEDDGEEFKFTVVGSYDFSVYKKVGDKTPVEVHDLGKSGIVAKFSLPESARNTNPLIKRFYYMIHMLSDGKTELLPVKYSEKTNNCEVAFNTCSTFTLVYTDVAYYVEEGTIISSKKYNAEYRVLTSGDTAGKIGTLEYLEPCTFKSAHKIHSKVTIKNITYKVRKVAANAFRENTKVESIYVGKYVQTIGRRAFYKCTNLKEVTIAGNVKKFGKALFYNDKALEKVEINSTKLKPANVGVKIFCGVNSSLKVVVPETKVTAYEELFAEKTMTSGVTFEAIK